MRSFTSSFKAWFLAFLGLTFGVFGAGLAATEVLIRTLVEPQDLFEQNISVFYGADTPNAAFGDSIVAAGFLPDGGDFVNLSTGGEPPAGMRIKVESYFAAHPAGKVILPANHNILRRTPDTQLDYTRIFAKQDRAPLRIFEQRHRGYSFLYWHTYLFKDFETNRVTLAHGGEVFTDKTQNARFIKLPPAERLQYGAGKALKEMPEVGDKSAVNKVEFQSMLEFLSATDADTCIVTFPMSPSFRATANDHTAFAEARAWFSEQAQRNKAKYLNLWDYFETDEPFIDPTHLSEAGAREITRVVLERCFGAAARASAS